MVNRSNGKPDHDVSAYVSLSDVGRERLEEDLRKIANEPAPTPRKRATKDRK